jgi:hypothetical protein
MKPFNLTIMTQGEHGRAYEHSDVMQVQAPRGGIADIRMEDSGAVRIIVREGFQFESEHGIGNFRDFEYIRVTKAG